MDGLAMSEREHIRVSINLAATCRYGHSFSSEIEITNLSETGCRIDKAPRGLMRGEQMTISFSDFELIEGRVRWLTKNRQAGIQFLSPIDLLDRHALQHASQLIAKLETPHKEESDMTENSLLRSAREDQWHRQDRPVEQPNRQANEVVQNNAISEDTPQKQVPDRIASLPISDLTRFSHLVEAAKSCGFNALNVELTNKGLSVRMTSES